MSTIERAQKLKKEAKRADNADTDRDEASAWSPDDSGDRQPPNGQLPASPGQRESSSGALRPATFQPAGPALRVDFEHLRRHSMYPPVQAEKRLSNEYRRIKRPLLANASGKGAFQVEHGNRIMLTSSVPGEGKTFTALNLALSIARDPDYSVTLIDADVADRDASSVLGVADSSGLLDLLADASLDPAELTRPTSIASLSVLPAGSWHSLSEELIWSGRMRAILERMSAPSAHHILLFDAPPVLAAPDAVSLSHQVGQVVMVVKAGSTPRQQVTAAVDQFDPDQAVNMLLNQSLGGSVGGDYGGYDGYGSSGA